MNRKLVQQGNATLMVSLPADWVKEFKLRKGQSVDLEIKGNQLVITTGAVVRKEEITLELNDDIESSVRTRLTVAYRQGYDRIAILVPSKKCRDLVLTTKSKLLGFDVIEQGESRVVLENIMEPALDQFPVIFEKVLYNVELLSQQVRAGEDYAATEERIFSYDNFCRRCISKNAIVSKKKMFYWTFLAIFVHVSRELVHFAQQKSKTVDVQLFEGLQTMLRAIRSAYAKRNPALLTQIHALEKELVYRKGYAALKKNGAASYHLLVAIRQCYLCTSSMTGILSADN